MHCAARAMLAAASCCLPSSPPSAARSRLPPSPWPAASTPPRRAAVRPRSSGAWRWWTRRARCSTAGTQRQLFIPASNTKIVVSGGGVGAAAARLDGARPASTPTGRWPTACSRATWCSTAGATRPSASAASPPTPCARAPARPTPFTRLRQLADGLRARGIREIHGDLVGDGSYFEPTLVHPGWEAFDLNWWYAAPVSGARLQRQQRRLHLGPGHGAGRAGA